RPEFLNRVDETIMFKPLTMEEVGKIVTKLIADLEERLKEKQIKLLISDEAKQYLAENGFDPVYGASPLKRFIQRNLETLLAREIIAGTIEENSTVQIVLTDGKIALKKLNSASRRPGRKRSGGAGSHHN